MNTELKENKKPNLRGYGLVVLVSGFLINFITDGMMYSFSIILNEIKNHYGVSQDMSNLIISLNIGFASLTGPLSSAMSNKFGSRVVIMVSSIILSFMIILSSFIPVYYILITYGLIGGITFGSIYLCNSMMIVEYYDTKLGIASGIVSSGSGLGTFALAPLVKEFNSNFSWKITLIALSGIVLQCCVLGALMRPNSSKDDKNQNCLEITVYENSNKCTRFDKGTSVKDFLDRLKSIGHFELLLNVSFVLILISNFFFAIGFFVPFIFIPVRAKELEISQFAWLFSIIGIVNIPSRVLFGLFADKKIIKSINMNTICTLFVAISLFVYLPLANFWSQACFSVLFGISSAGMNTLTTLYLVEIVGSSKFNKALGLLSFSRGIGCILGPYLTGLLYEKTKTSLSTFLFAGVSLILSFIFSAFVSIMEAPKSNKIRL